MDQKNKQRKNERNEDKELLKAYLNQYYAGRIKRTQLERRLKNIREEMATPIGGYGYSPVNYGGTNKVGPGAASFVYRMSEIETRIESQKPGRKSPFKSHGYYGLFGGKQHGADWF